MSRTKEDKRILRARGVCQCGAISPNFWFCFDCRMRRSEAARARYHQRWRKRYLAENPGAL